MEAGNSTQRCELGTFLGPRGVGSLRSPSPTDVASPAQLPGVIWQHTSDRERERERERHEVMVTLAARDMETHLSNNLGLQICKNGELLGMGMDFNHFGNKGISILYK